MTAIINDMITVTITGRQNDNSDIIVITYFMKNGRNGIISFITSDGTTSANKIAPVDMMLQTRPESGWASVADVLC